MTSIIVRRQERRQTTAEWESINPIPLDGELCVETRVTGVKLVKIGDGVTHWLTLPYLTADATNPPHATDVIVAPGGQLVATNAQAALLELDSDLTAEAAARGTADTNEAAARTAADLLKIDKTTAGAQSVLGAVAAGTPVAFPVGASRLLGRKATGDVGQLTAAEALAILAAYSSAQTDSAISTQIAALVGGAPGLLDTLKELADALGDDPNFAATMTAALATKAADSAVVKLANVDQTIDGLKKFLHRPLTVDLAGYSAIPVDGSAGAAAAWSTLNGTGSDLNILNVRNGENILVDVDLPLTVIPPKVARGGMITVAAGKTLTIPAGFECGPWQCFDTTAAGSHVVLKGTSVVRPEWWGVVTGTAASQSAALERCRADVKLAHAAGGPGPTVILYRSPLTYRFDAALTTALDPRREVHRSDIVSGAVWDLSNMTGTTLWATVVQTNDGNGHFESECLSNLWIKGPTSPKTTVDFLKLGDGTGYAANLAFAGLNIQGFRDQIQWYTNAFLNSFRQCQIGFGAARHALYVLPGAAVVGENEKFYDCAIVGARIGLEIPNISGVKFVFTNTSIDYNDITFICDRGNVEVNGGHIEDSPSGVPPSIYRITDGVSTNLSTTFTSAAFTFVAGLDDTGITQRNIVHANYPAGTKIVSVDSDHSVTLNNAATASGAALSVVCCADQSVYVRGDHGSKLTYIGVDFYTTFTAGQRAAWHKITDLGVNNGGGGGGFNASIDVIGCGYNPTVLGIPFGLDNTVYSPNGYTAVGGTRVRWIANHPTQQTFNTQWPMHWVTREGLVILLDKDVSYEANPAQLIVDNWPWNTRPRLQSFPKTTAKDRVQLVNQRLYLVRFGTQDNGLLVGASQTIAAIFDAAATASGITDARWAWYTAGVPTSTTLGRAALSNTIAAVTADQENSASRNIGSSPGIEPRVEHYLGIWFNATVTPELWGVGASKARREWGMSAASGVALGGYVDIGTSVPPSTIAKATILDPDFLPWLALVPTTT